MLQPSIQYRIRAVGEVGDASGFTEIELSVNLPPYGGDCSISPDEGKFKSFIFYLSQINVVMLSIVIFLTGICLMQTVSIKR